MSKQKSNEHTCDQNGSQGTPTKIVQVGVEYTTVTLHCSKCGEITGATVDSRKLGD